MIRANDLLKPVTRWRPERKAMVCWALADGDVTRAQLRAAHGLTDDEIAEWMAAYRNRGPDGLKLRTRRRAA